MGKGNGFFGFSKLQALLLLRSRERSGYELMREIGKAMGKKPSAGQIYPMLAKMVKQSYLHLHSMGAREKKTYALTAKGREALGKMIDRANSIVEAVLSEKLKECEHCGCIVYGKAHGKKIKGKMHYFCCSSCAADEKQCRR